MLRVAAYSRTMPVSQFRMMSTATTTENKADAIFGEAMNDIKAKYGNNLKVSYL